MVRLPRRAAQLGLRRRRPVAAAAITIGTDDAFHAVVVLNAASYVLAFVLLVAGPGARGPPRRGRQRQGGGWSEVAARPRLPLAGRRELRLRDGLPRAQRRDAGLHRAACWVCPGWVSGAVYVINTVLIGLGQGLVVRRMTGAVRWRIVVLAAGLMVAAFLLMYAAGDARPSRTSRSRWCWSAPWSTRSARWPADRCSPRSPPSRRRTTCAAATSRSSSCPGTPRPPSRRCSTSGCSTGASLAVWAVLSGLALFGAACCLPLRRLMPLAAAHVTNTVRVPTEA